MSALVSRSCSATGRTANSVLNQRFAGPTTLIGIGRELNTDEPARTSWKEIVVLPA